MSKTINIIGLFSSTSFLFGFLAGYLTKKYLTDSKFYTLACSNNIQTPNYNLPHTLTHQPIYSY
jgi:hypothetical protein